MSDIDKKNIYVPSWVERQLKSDARHFEVVKKDNVTANMNKFLNMLLKSYYNEFTSEYVATFIKIKNVLVKNNIKNHEELSKQILDSLYTIGEGKRKGVRKGKVQIKPVTDTEPLFYQIDSEVGNEDYFSSFFRKMLISYCEKPMYEREKIIFKQSFDFISEACKTNRCITFRTIWDSKIHHVIPYEICRGQDETHNYLLCVESQPDQSNNEVRVYRLNRIVANSLNFSRKSLALSDDYIQKLELTKKYGSQHAINETLNIIVRLNDYGLRSYNRIYIDRPIYDSIKDDVDGSHIMAFSCSSDQIFLYFRRFGMSDAEIISPQELRKKMIDFHARALETYGGKSNE